MATWHIVSKDLLILTRDRRALGVLIVLPMVFIAILGFSTGRLMGWRNENTMLQLAVFDRCDNATTQRVIAALERRSSIEMRRVDDSEQARMLVDEGDYMAAVIIGQEFEQRVDALTLGDLLDPDQGRLRDGIASLAMELYFRPTQTIAAALTEQVVFGETLRVVLPIVARRNPVARMMMAESGMQEAAEHVSQAASSGHIEIDYGGMVYQVIVPSYTVLFAFFLVNIMARSFLAESANGTLARLRAAPVRTHEVLIGKTMPFWLVSVVQAIVLFMFGRLLFGMSWGPRPLLLLPVIACTSFAATGLGLLTAVLVRSDAQVSAYANLVVIALAGLSGCFMPRQWLPDMMRDLSLAIPHAWSLIGYDQILNTAVPNVARVAHCCGMLVMFGLIFYLLGAWRFRRLASA